MTTMIDLINALTALTGAMTALTEKITKEYIDTFEALGKGETPKELPAAEQKAEPVTFTQLRSRLAEISRSGRTAKVKELIARYGAEKLSAVKPEDYAALLADAEVIANA